MKNESTPCAKAHLQSSFFSLRVLIGLFIVLAGLFLALAGLGAFSALAQSTAQAQQKYKIITNSKGPLVPNGFDCSKIHELGIDKQMNFRAGAIMIACGQARGGGTWPNSHPGALSQFIKKLFSPLAYGGTDVDLITGTETYPYVNQSTTFSWANPDNPNQIVVAYIDTRDSRANPSDSSGASVSTDGGLTFTRLTKANGQSPFTNTGGSPVVLYNRPTATWYTVWLDGGCGGLGGYKSTTPWDPDSWNHYCIHTGTEDDRESGWTDMNPSSPFYGRTYVSWNDFARGANIFVRYSTDDGNTWTNERQITNGGTFIRNVQITGDLVTGDVYIAGMNEGGGGFPHPCNNLFYRSTDGGNTWTNTYTGPTFSGPGRCAEGYFAGMYCSPSPGYWRHEGWGEPAAFNGVVHYVYAARNPGNGDPGDVFYIRSTDSGVTFSAPFQLNSNTDPTKAQWEPNLSVSPSGTLFAVWYDERDGGGASTCIAGSNSPCYRMYARRSNENGVTWLPDDTFSDVVSPLPAQPDPGIVPNYVSDYDYASALATKHLSSWVDGRVPINGTYQQDAFTDRELVAPMAQSAFSRKTHGAAGTFDIPLALTGNVGIECRSGGATNDYQMIINFATTVTVGSASVTSGTGSVSSFSVSGPQVTVNLTGVGNAQRITVTLSNVNDGTHMGNVPVSMGVLVGDVNGNALVNASDVSLTKSQAGQPVTGSNFREDVNANGAISATDVAQVKANVGTALPP
jgi:dockerin type I repeat protein